MVNEPNSEPTPTDLLPQDQLRALYQIIKRMNSVYELPDLLSFILDQVLEATGGQRGYLLLAQESAYNDEEPRLEVKAARGDGVDVSQVEADVYRFVSRTVVLDVLGQGEPRIIADIRQDVRYINQIGRTSAVHKWPSILAVPLKAADRLVGLIYIEHPEPRAFLDPDLDFLSAFAGQAAVAIERTQQSQNRIEELERLNEVSRSVVRVLDLDQVLIRILREATKMLHVETGSVLLADGETGELVFRISVQEGRPVHIGQKLKVGEGVAGWVAEHGQPLLVPDVQQDPRWYGEVGNGFATRSILCVPLKIDHHVIGVLQALNKKGSVGFTDQDLALLSAFATSSTVAIENARLFAEARQARELHALNETAAVLSSSLELNAILETGLAKALDVMGAEAGAVSLLDEETDELVVATTRGWRRGSVRVGARIPVGEGLSGQVVVTGESVVTGDVSHDPRVTVETLRNEGVQAMVLVPMHASGRLVGVLSTMSYTPHIFTSEEIDMLSAIGGMFSVAVENARLYEEARSNLMRLTYFDEVGGALTASLDLERVMQVIMEGVTSLIGVERASVFLIDEATNDLVLQYSADLQETIRLPAPWLGIAGWIASHGEPAIANDVRRDHRFLPDIDAITQFDTQSILGAPLKIDDRVIGVVEVLNKLGGPFTERDQELLVEFGKWAAIALHNARLYQELEEAKERLANAEAIAAMGDMALNLTHELNNRISIIPLTVNRIQAKCAGELDNPYLAEKLGVIDHVAGESKTIIRRIREPFEVVDEEPVSVSDCLAAALNVFQLRPGIDVVERYQPNLPPVMATPKKLIETFCHVIGNALDAMGNQGQLLLSTRRRLDGLVEVVISDDGPGVPPKIRKVVFELGYTTKAAQGGLGLGLWWTRVYVSRLGGQVKIHSSPNRGTVVSIRLPAAQEIRS